MKKPILSFILLMAFVLSSCLESNEKITLNPDGSGKMLITVSGPLDPMGFGGGGDKVEKARGEVSNFLDENEGIELYRDLDFSFNFDSSKVTIQAVAYFKDINKVLIKNGMNFHYEMIDDDEMKITILMDKKDKEEAEDEAKEPRSIEEEKNEKIEYTEEEMKQKIEQQKSAFKKGFGMMQMFMVDMKMSAQLSLPGEIDDIEGFTQIDDENASISFEFDRLLKYMQKKMDDDDYWREQIEKGVELDLFGNGGDPFDNMDEKEVFRILLDSDVEEPFIIVEDPETQFNYQEEVTEAEEEWKKIQDEYLKSNDTGYDQETEEIEASGTYQVSDDGSFELMMPAGWAWMSELSESATVKFGNDDEGTYTIGIFEPLENFNDIDLSRYSEIVIQKMKENLDDPEVEKIPSKEIPEANDAVAISGSSSISEFDYEMHKLEGGLEDYRYAYLITTVKGSYNFYQIVSWSLKGDFDKNVTTFMDIVYSFSELKK